MPNYQNGKIYQLCYNDFFYIGSTTLLLCKRYSNHIQDSKRNPNQKCYAFFNNNGWDNVKIVLLENYKCNSREELVAKEDEYIRKNLNNPKCLNIRKATTTYEEKIEYNKLRRRVKIDKRYKITLEIKEDIIKRYKNNEKQSEICKIHNLSKYGVWNVIQKYKEKDRDASDRYFTQILPTDTQGLNI